MAKGMYEEGLREFDQATRLEPRFIDAYLKKGIFYLSQGDEKHMESELRTAVKVAPEVLSTRLILSSYYLKKNNPTKALAVLNEGLSGKRADTALYCGMAKVQFSAGKNAPALQYLEKAKESAPESLAPYFIAATFHAGGGDYDKAISEYSSALAKDSTNVNAMIRAAALLELSGNDQLAVNLYHKAKETGNTAAYIALAKRYSRSNEPQKSLAILDEALKRNPRATEIQETKIRILAREQRYKDAIRACGDLEAFDAERGARLKVETYLAQKNTQEALLTSRKEISRRPDSPAGHLLLATVYRAMNDHGHAIEELQLGKKLDGKNPGAALMLAEEYAAAGNYAKAILDCEEIIRNHPDYAPAHFSLGTYLQANGQEKKSIDKYLATLSLVENNVPALNNLAYLYAEGYGSAESAARLARTALTIDPGNPAVMDTLGYACLKCGKFREARRLLEQAAALLPGNPTVNYHLALAYKESGERTKAVALLRQALSFGNFTEARQAQSLLTDLN